MMKNKIACFLLTLLIVLSVTACNKDDTENGDVSTYDPLAENQAGADGENPDAWWQQYTTEPMATSPQTPQGSKDNATKSSTESNTTTKKSITTTKKISSGSTASAEPYTRVDANTMKYNVKDGSSTGVVTLTKSGSNTYIKQTLDSANAAFGTSYTAANTMCFSSTLPSMSGSTIVFVFSSSSKTKDTLQLVTQFDNGNPVAFVTMTVDSDKVPMSYWPCRSSGTTAYTEYYETFKGALGSQYTEGTNIFKSLLDDDCVKTFLTW